MFMLGFDVSEGLRLAPTDWLGIGHSAVGPPSPQPVDRDPKLTCHPNTVGPSYASRSPGFLKMLFQDRILDFHL